MGSQAFVDCFEIVEYLFDENFRNREPVTGSLDGTLFLLKTVVRVKKLILFSRAIPGPVSRMVTHDIALLVACAEVVTIPPSRLYLMP